MEDDAEVRRAVTAASAALGRPLAAATPLAGGSGRSLVLRCADPDAGTVIVKTYPATHEGRDGFTAEASGLALAGDTGVAPQLLAVDASLLMVVMSDFGTGHSLADLLLGEVSGDAGAALLRWARACAELSAGTIRRTGELVGLRDRYCTGGPAASFAGGLRDQLAAVPERAAQLGVSEPDGLAGELAEVARAVQPDRFGVFSPGDLCPDNNLVLPDGVRLLDFESAGIYSVFLDAAYIRMPFSTCWCVFRLPAQLSQQAEAAYREIICSVLPPLSDDQVWAAGLRRGIAAWSMNSMDWLLRAAMRDDRPLDEYRTAPTTRQLMRYRWQLLAAELEPSGDLPALAELARSLLAATVSWDVPDLPGYPALRDR